MNAQLDRQISADLDRFCAAWKTNDGPTVGSFFVEDGSLVNPFGQRADGRNAVAAMYTEYFGGMLRGSSTTYRLGSARRLDGDHAFTDGEQLIYGPDGALVLVVHLAALLRREAGAWRFVDARPYTPATPPV
jgi:uncharacterized protein (TIGR02246 family)